MQGFPVPAPAPLPSPKVELKIQCKNLVNKDILSLSDPQVYLYHFDDHTGKWDTRPRAMTERIKDSLNPVFIKNLQVDFRFQTIQRLKFVVYDIDDKHSGNFSDQDFLGEVETDLASIVCGARETGGSVIFDLRSPKHLCEGRAQKNLGQIIIQAEDISPSNTVVNFQIRGLDLTKKGLFKSRPTAYFVIQRVNEDGTFSPVYKSKHIRSEDDPIWKAFSIKGSVLCNGDRQRSLKIEVMNYKDNGAHTLISATKTFTLEGLSRLSFPHSMPLPHVTATSALIFQSYSEIEAPSFLSYITGGIQIGLCVAVDFTASNGRYNDPRSLHYRNPTGVNDYTRAIRTVGDILQTYDSGKKFPVYGFGGRIQGVTHHAFALNNNRMNPEVSGVEGILEAYWKAHSLVELSGPTNFAPVIEQVTRITQESGPNRYTILLIITDGAVTDMDDTIRAIKEASKRPMSIIIVGVGPGQFTNMNILDGDDEDNATKMSRDIVQFVAARDFPLDNAGGELEAALLAEVPDQLVDYMMLNKIRPQPRAYMPVAGAPSNIPVPYSNQYPPSPIPIPHPPVPMAYAPPVAPPVGQAGSLNLSSPYALSPGQHYPPNQPQQLYAASSSWPTSPPMPHGSPVPAQQPNHLSLLGDIPYPPKYPPEYPPLYPPELPRQYPPQHTTQYTAQYPPQHPTPQEQHREPLSTSESHPSSAVSTTDASPQVQIFPVLSRSSGPQTTSNPTEGNDLAKTQ
ncbi:copine-8-like protein [Dissophora ornata]|nr:copine-8-like protein [Dissophora ornata]